MLKRVSGGARYLVAFAGIVSSASGWSFAQSASHQVSLERIASVTQYYSAAISPDGDHVAYLRLTPLPMSDSYDVRIFVQAVRSGAAPTEVARYFLPPSDVFDSYKGQLKDSAGQFIWSADGLKLLFTSHAGGLMKLNLWNLTSEASVTLGSPHREIALHWSDREPRPVVTMTDGQADGPSSMPRDRSVVLREDTYFGGYFVNPAQSPAETSRHADFNWQTLTLGAVTVEKSGRGHEAIGYRGFPTPVQYGDGFLYSEGRAASPSGKFRVIMRDASRHVASPSTAETYFSLSIVSGDGSNPIAEIVTGGELHALFPLGWNAAETKYYVLERLRQSCAIVSIGTNGEVKTVYSEPSDLEVPEREQIDEFMTGRQSKVYSPPANEVILTRSRGTVPQELVRIDLTTGALMSLASPNADLANSMNGTVRYLPIKSGRFYARLYLPSPPIDRPLPLVVTTYRSSKGYPHSTLDEVPIIPLVNDGVAVLNFDVADAGLGSDSGDFDFEIANRVDEPLRAIEAEIADLAKEKIIDPGRVAMSGGSYGDELSMYAYFKSSAFRTISTAGSDRSPMSYLTSGLRFGDYLQSRGYLGIDPTQPTAVAQWTRTASAFNGRPDRPPVLWQTSDAERYWSLETWYRLKQSGAQIEWIEYPAEGHEKSSPADKWWVYRRNLDWFRFWLQDYEDSDPSKAEQYQHWREMRDAWQRAVASAERSN